MIPWPIGYEPIALPTELRHQHKLKYTKSTFYSSNYFTSDVFYRDSKQRLTESDNPLSPAKNTVYLQDSGFRQPFLPESEAIFSNIYRLSKKVQKYGNV